MCSMLISILKMKKLKTVTGKYDLTQKWTDLIILSSNYNLWLVCKISPRDGPNS